MSEPKDKTETNKHAEFKKEQAKLGVVHLPRANERPPVEAVNGNAVPVEGKKKGEK